jgi:hypothetical protein
LESVEKVLWLAISLLILLIGLVLLFSIFFAAFNPYDNIAFANAEKLRAAINEACISNGPVTLTNFELRQNIPSLTGAAGLVTEIFPKWMMKLNGDPNYVLYYEAFPPGEAVGWEVYQDLDYRLLTPFISSESSAPSAALDNYASTQLQRFLDKKPGAKVDAVLVNNIILNDGFKPEFITNQYTSQRDTTLTSSAESKPFSSGGALPTGPSLKQSFYQFGKWRNVNEKTGEPNEGDNVFLFNNYAGMTVLQKSLVKYMPCGENSLCLKTRKGVYRYPLLEECKGIKNIQIIYDARSRGAVYTVAGATGVLLYFFGGPLLTAGSAVFSALPGGVLTKLAIGTTGAYLVGKEVIRYVGTAFLAVKTSDLNLASPCVISGDGAIEIKKTYCKEVELPGYNPSHCTQVVSYPLYKYDKEKGTLEKVQIELNDHTKIDALHYACLEKVNGEEGKDIIEKVENKNYGSDDQCVQIYISKKAVGCWTPDPWKEDITISDSQLIASLLGFTPIKDSLDHTGPSSDNLFGRIIVLKSSGEKNLNDFMARWEKKLSWGWPWPFD